MSISVIIPLYNSEKHIKQCISSLLNQSHRDFELIIINDGSNDSSYAIVNEMLKGRADTQIYTQENKGVSSARNYGIEKATKEYITFIDSDDIVASDFIETLINSIKDDDNDLIISGSIFLKDSKTINKRSIKEDVWSINELSSKYEYLDYTTSIHGKIYKKSILDRNRITFKVGMSYAEDRDFNLEYIKSIKKVKNIAYTGYYYNTDIDSSLSKKHYKYKLKNNCIYWNKVIELSNNEHFDSYIANRMFHALIDDISEMLYQVGWYNTMQEIRLNGIYINHKFIKKHIDKIDAPIWHKICYNINLQLFILILNISLSYNK